MLVSPLHKNNRQRGESTKIEKKILELHKSEILLLLWATEQMLGK